MTPFVKLIRQQQSANEFPIERKEILLSARGLRRAFGGQIVLDGVDLDLHEGEVVLLRGENGSGKTTLLNILTGNIEPDGGTIEYKGNGSTRDYRFPRRWWRELNPWDHFRPEFAAQKGIGRTWQDVRLFNSQSLRDNIAVAAPNQPGENPILALFTPGNVRRSEQEIREKADSVFLSLKLDGRQECSADKISLGESKRVAIARAITGGARILFLDEPLAGLDSQGISNVLALLSSMIRQHRVTLVIVEHVLNHIHLRNIVSTDWILQNGKLDHNRRVPGTDKASQPRPAWLDVLVNQGTNIIEEPLPRGGLLTRIQRPIQKNDRKQILRVRDLLVQRGSHIAVGLDDERRASGFDLSIADGEIVIIHAPNGWGKTTLLDALAGVAPAKCSEVKLDGFAIDRRSTWEVRRAGLAYVPTWSRLFPSLTSRDVAVLLGNSPEVISDFGDKALAQLSGGQLQKVKLSAIEHSSYPVKLLCLDEPFTGLDDKSCEAFVESLACSPAAAILITAPTIAECAVDEHL